MFEKTESRRETKYNFDMILIETSHKFIITQPFFLRNIFSLIFANLKELLFLALFFACILADTLFACLLPHRIRRFFQFFRTLCFVVSRVSFLDYPLLGFFFYVVSTCFWCLFDSFLLLFVVWVFFLMVLPLSGFNIEVYKSVIKCFDSTNKPMNLHLNQY